MRRSIARPPSSLSVTRMSATSGRVVSIFSSSLRLSEASPLASVLGRLDLLALGVEALVHAAEEIVRRQERRGIELDRGLAVHGQVRRRRAVEEAADDADLDRRLGRQDLGRGRERHLEPLGHEILDLEAGAADRGTLRVHMRQHAPASGRRRFRQRDRHAVAAGTLRAQREALRLDAVGPHEPQDERRVAGGARVQSRSSAATCTVSPGR